MKFVWFFFVLAHFAFETQVDCAPSISEYFPTEQTVKQEIRKKRYEADVGETKQIESPDSLIPQNVVEETELEDETRGKNGLKNKPLKGKVPKEPPQIPNITTEKTSPYTNQGEKHEITTTSTTTPPPPPRPIRPTQPPPPPPPQHFNSYHGFSHAGPPSHYSVKHHHSYHHPYQYSFDDSSFNGYDVQPVQPQYTPQIEIYDTPSDSAPEQYAYRHIHHRHGFPSHPHYRHHYSRFRMDDDQLGSSNPYSPTPASYPAPSSHPAAPSYSAPSSSQASYTPDQCSQNILISCQPIAQTVPCSAYYPPAPVSTLASPSYRLAYEQQQEEGESLLGQSQQSFNGKEDAIGSQYDPSEFMHVDFYRDSLPEMIDDREARLKPHYKHHRQYQKHKTTHHGKHGHHGHHGRRIKIKPDEDSDENSKSYGRNRYSMADEADTMPSRIAIGEEKDDELIGKALSKSSQTPSTSPQSIKQIQSPQNTQTMTQSTLVGQETPKSQQDTIMQPQQASTQATAFSDQHIRRMEAPEMQTEAMMPQVALHNPESMRQNQDVPMSKQMPTLTQSIPMHMLQQMQMAAMIPAQVSEQHMGQFQGDMPPPSSNFPLIAQRVSITQSPEASTHQDMRQMEGPHIQQAPPMNFPEQPHHPQFHNEMLHADHMEDPTSFAIVHPMARDVNQSLIFQK